MQKGDGSTDGELVRFRLDEEDGSEVHIPILAFPWFYRKKYERNTDERYCAKTSAWV